MTDINCVSPNMAISKTLQSSILAWMPANVFLCNRVVPVWNSLAEYVVLSPTAGLFRSILNLAINSSVEEYFRAVYAMTDIAYTAAVYAIFAVTYTAAVDTGFDIRYTAAVDVTLNIRDTVRILIGHTRSMSAIYRTLMYECIKCDLHNILLKLTLTLNLTLTLILDPNR